MEAGLGCWKMVLMNFMMVIGWLMRSSLLIEFDHVGTPLVG
jgi:hypothetical protein